MGDATLSLASLLGAATPLTTTITTDTPATALPATGGDAPDPFAALLSTLTGTGALAATPAVPPIAMPTATPPALPVVSADVVGASDITATANDAGSDDGDTPADPLGDPLADAITQGMTAVLALGQPAPPPATPAPTIATIVSRTAIAAATARGIALPLPSPQRIDMPAVSDPAVTATAQPAAADPAAPAEGAPAAAPADPTAADAAPSDNAATPAPSATPASPYSPAVIAALRAAIAATRPGHAVPPSPDAATAAPVAAAAAIQSGAATTVADTDPAIAPVAAGAIDTAQGQTSVRQVSRVPRALGLTAKVTASAEEQRTIRTDPRRATAAAMPAAPFATGLADRALPAAAADPSSVATGVPADAAVQQQLSIAQDGQWLDTLARDIAMSAGNGSDLHFKLNPQHLGSLTVQIAQGTDGASIRLTADSDAARTILVDAQPKLIAEARAQGLKVSDTQVDLSRQHNGEGAARQNEASAGQNGQNRSPLPDRQPFAGSVAADPESAESADDSSALYA